MPYPRAVVVHPNRACATRISTMLLRKTKVAKVVEVTSLVGMRRALSDLDGPALAVIHGKLLGPDAGITPADLARDFPDLVFVAHLLTPSRTEILDLLHRGFHGVLPDDAPAEVASRVLSLAIAGFVFVPHVTERPAWDSDAVGSATGGFDAREVARTQNILSLTRRQREVLDLITEGQSNKSIAIRLGIRETTVKHHVSSILRVMDFGCRSAAAAWRARMDYLIPNNPDVARS